MSESIKFVGSQPTAVIISSPKWRKTSDQLPLPGIRVLVFSSSGINIAEYDEESFPKSPWTFDDMFYDGECPTHWFPFPAFPKDET